jgi:hypothetical protein
MGGRWRRLFGRSAPADAIDDEIREHLDQRTADLMR